MARAKKAKPAEAVDVSDGVKALAYLVSLGHDPASLPEDDAALVDLANQSLAALAAAKAGDGAKSEDQAQAGEQEAGEAGAGDDDDAEGEGAEADADRPSIAEIEERLDRGERVSFSADGEFQPQEAHLTENMPVKYKPHGKDVAVVERLKVWIGETANMFSHLECEEGSEVEDLVENMKHATRELSQRF